MRWILAATAVTAAALATVPSPCLAAGHLMGTEQPRNAPSPGHMRVERQVSLIAAAVHYLEDHLGVEIVPASVDRIGVGGMPLELHGAGTAMAAPAVAGTLAFGDRSNPASAFNAMSAAVSASQNRLHLTLRMRW
jgi:hypothetical protein